MALKGEHPKSHPMMDEEGHKKIWGNHPKDDKRGERTIIDTAIRSKIEDTIAVGFWRIVALMPQLLS
ncbi:hypothetical protein K432DRAFT_384266 [Lepidopterella palustris CBS 459.81]|uniref:Uncharacterized protein n=1 Tax=Lepidopterella palustris CBS 459.81 TaxID=1314670 RepID=A0A8E2JCV6_9PEZI|nr:hypothetical protein K432DRAFT_384266 [Lepidopterella palustris CBS 459.81]